MAVLEARHGVYAAALTPVGADGEPELGRLAAYCRQLLDDGCDGVAPLGTTGEAQSLPFRFRLQVPETLARSGLLADRVILGTGATALGDAVAFTSAAVGAGLTNVLVLPPFYVKGPSADGLRDYYARLIDAVGCSGLRLYLYHFPQMTSVPIPVELIRRLHEEFGEVIAGVKDSSGDFTATQAFLAAVPGLRVFPSSEAVLVRAMSAGAAGVISATTNASAPWAAATLQASGGERDHLQALIAAVRGAIARYPLTPALKQIQAWRSGDPGWTRVLPPLCSLPPVDAAELRAALDRLGALERQPIPVATP